MQLPRWQRHWWEWAAQPLSSFPEEPKVWVDPSLYIEPLPRAPRASGTIPPPTCIGPHSTLPSERAETEGDLVDTVVEPAGD